MDPDAEKLPNFRKISVSSALRTLAYAGMYLALAFWGGVLGVVLALALREGRRAWFRRRLKVPPTATASGSWEKGVLSRAVQSPMAQAQLLELLALAVAAIAFGVLHLVYGDAWSSVSGH